MWAIPFNGGAAPLGGAFPFFPLGRGKRKDALEGPLGAIGSLEVRLVRHKRELRKAQRLRFKVFYKDGGAVADAKTALTRRDADRFDKFCDHLIVVDTAARTRFGKIKPRVVGAYRMLRSDVAKDKKCGFYSADEYDLAPLLARHPGKRFLELGRSCVLEEYRGKRTIELLWRGLLAYIRHHNIDALIGCASFEGANPLQHAMALSFIAQNMCAEGEWRVCAREDRYAPMEILSKDAVDMRKALSAMPPLIKGYMRLGAKFGDGAVIDRKFNTVDVFVIMPVAEMDARYLEHFGGAGASDEKRAA
jgi:L-ornithine Nalpha-acyltransferase